MSRYEQALELWSSYRIETEADLDKYLDNFRVLFAYHSGKIENDSIRYHDTRELFESGQVSGFSGDPRTLFEQHNQKTCYDFLKGRVVAREPISLELIRETHRVLTAGTYDERRYIQNGERPGEFKKHDYVTGLHEVGSPAAEVERDLGDLLGEIAELGECAGPKLLRAGTYFHARFEDIHPFADGNGRVGRTLLNYFLMIHGHPPLIVYAEDKMLYYEALLAYDEKESIDPLHKFLEYETEQTWRRAVELHRGERAPRKGLDDLLGSR